MRTHRLSSTSASPLALLALLAVGSGCGSTAPQGTTAAGINEANYAVVGARDRQFEFCSESTFDTALEEIMDEYALMGCAAGVARDGKVLYLTGAGDMDADDPDTWVEGDGIPYGIDTLQPIGSVSKPLTALSLLRLAELGHVGVKDSLGDILGDAVGHHPDWVQDITVYELLSHTSGISDPATVARPHPAPTCDGGVLDCDDIDENSLGYEDIDWAAWGGTEGSASGRDPLLAQKVMVFADEPIDTEAYSNIGYLLLGAVIQSIVTDPDFDGFDDYPNAQSDAFEATWEAWVWWVFAGQGELRDENLYSTVLRHPWRELDDAYPNLAVGYDSTGGNGSYTQSGEIAFEDYRDDFGWVAPSGGFMLTIGDLLRLGIMIDEEEAIFDNDYFWDAAKQGISEVRGVGYGYGLYQINSTAGMWGHGGTVDGFSSGVFAGDASTLVVAWQCNTTPMNGNSYAALHTDVTNRLSFAAKENTFDVKCPDPGGLPKSGLDYDAIDVLSVDYFAGLFQSFADSVDRYGLERATSLLEYALSSSDAGAAAQRNFESGDWDAAAECLLDHMGDDQGDWSCGSDSSTTTSSRTTR